MSIEIDRDYLTAWFRLPLEERRVLNMLCPKGDRADGLHACPSSCKYSAIKRNVRYCFDEINLNEVIK